MIFFFATSVPKHVNVATQDTWPLWVSRNLARGGLVGSIDALDDDVLFCPTLGTVTHDTSFLFQRTHNQRSQKPEHSLVRQAANPLEKRASILSS